MRTWGLRTREEASLLNPSYCGLIAWHVAGGYLAAEEAPLSFELAFLAFPITLHKPTRDVLPGTLRTSMAMWLERNSQALVGFSDRAEALVPFAREGLLFGAGHGLLDIGREGFVVPSTRPRWLTPFLRESTPDVQQTLKKAIFVGKWFAGSGTAATVMALWGVRP